MKNRKFTIEAYENLNEQSVRLKLTDRIGSYENSAYDIRYIVENALKNGITKAELYLSTAGGSTIEAQEIVIELKKFQSVQITVGALAASAATYILTQFPSKAYAESQFMIHKPSMVVQGTAEEIKADLKLLENTQEIYRKAYAKAFGKTEEEVDELWKNDYWMTAQQAKDLGLISEIINEEFSWDTQAVATLSACGAPYIPNTNNLKTMDRNVIIAAVGLAADATDTQIEAKLKELKSRAGSAEALQDKLDEAQTQKVKDLVAKAVASKKITADQVETYESLATANYDATEKALNALPEVTALSGSIVTPQSFNAPEDRKDWTYEDYLEKAPEAYEELMAKDEKKAIEIFNKRRK